MCKRKKSYFISGAFVVFSLVRLSSTVQFDRVNGIPRPQHISNEWGFGGKSFNA